ncbi:MAG: globin family protein [Gammaproteobacteria bacterium]
MTPKQIELVSGTWEMVLPISDQAAAMFYARLFEIAPEVKPLFSGDMEAQGKKLMQMINTAVDNIEDVEKIIPALEDLGKRHVGYGVTDEHYAQVAEALLWTLEQGLGDAFTEDVKQAWTETYMTLAGVMIEASKEAA